MSKRTLLISQPLQANILTRLALEDLLLLFFHRHGS